MKFTVFSKISRPGRPVKLYFSVPVDLYTVFSDPKTLVKNLAKKMSNIGGQTLLTGGAGYLLYWDETHRHFVFVDCYRLVCFRDQ